jgi:hypothetical protein
MKNTLTYRQMRLKSKGVPDCLSFLKQEKNLCKASPVFSHNQI